MTQYPNYAAPGYGVPTNPRPTSVTVLAIIGIIWAALLLICNGFGLFGLVLMQTQSMNSPGLDEIRNNSFLWATQIITPVVGILIAIILMVGSIGALGLKPWGRLAMMTYAGVAIVIGLVNAVVTIGFINPIMSREAANNPNAQAFATGQTIGTYFGILLVLAYPLFVLIYMNKAHVKAAFAGQPTAGAAPAYPYPPQQFPPNFQQ